MQLMPGAIAIGDNLLWRQEFNAINLIGSGWQDDERLLTGTLQPKCVGNTGENSSLYGIEVTAKGPLPRPLDQFGLLGVSAHPFDIVVDQEVDKVWEPVESYTIHRAQSVYSRHVVVQIHTPDPAATGWRLSWGGANLAFEIGSIYPGRGLAHPDLTDQEWGQEYPDRALRDTAQGGQHYAEDTNTYRILRVPMGSVNALTQLGVLPHGRMITLPEPSTTASVSFSDGTFTFGSNSGTGTYAGILTEGGVYRMDYTAAQFHTTGTNHSRFSLGSTNEYLYGERIAPVSGELLLGRNTVVFQRVAGGTSLQISCGSTLAGNGAAFTVHALSEVQGPGALWADEVMEDNMQSFLARHGTSRPIIFLPNPSDPMTSRVTGIYGLIRDTVRTTNLEGQLTQSELVIEEQR